MVDVYVEKIGNTWFGVAFEKETIRGTSFASTEKRALEGLGTDLRSNLTAEQKAKTAFAKKVTATLKDIYDGKEASHTFAFATNRMPKYSMKVIETVCKVPPGYVTSYGAVAKAAGGGPRAVGQIMAKNPFAPICPCHRVVRSDLTLGGYGGGLDLKLAFLKRERHGYSSNKEIPIDGKKLQVFPVEFAINKAEEG